jgi:hypothetical protein
MFFSFLTRRNCEIEPKKTPSVKKKLAKRFEKYGQLKIHCWKNSVEEKENHEIWTKMETTQRSHNTFLS